MIATDIEMQMQSNSFEQPECISVDSASLNNKCINRQIEFVINLLSAANDDFDAIDVHSEEEKEVEKILALSAELQLWALKHKITHSAVNDLLEIFSKTCAITDLPKDSRTLLSTPTNVNIVKLGDGSYWHHGLKNCLEQILYNIKTALNISLIINIDGLPIWNSSKNEFWPILCAVYEMPNLPIMAVGVYLGESKPKLEPFLNFFVDEFLDITNNPLIVNGHKVIVKIKCFVCDTPARAFIKGVVGFNLYHGCIKCTTIGEFENNRMSFPRIDCERRTDADFRNKIDADHHKEYTPLEKLPIDLIQDIVVADALHLIDLGIMKRLLCVWTTGCYNFETKWSALEIQKISNLLNGYNSSMPTEIHRALRTLNCLKFWKGIEYRTFLLYLGPVILKDFLNSEVYNHFLSLFCAITICSCKKYLKYTNVANELLKHFIEKYIEIYGSSRISSNVHNLCHLVDDVNRFGDLTYFSSYPFESFLGQIKSLLRTGNRPLAQCAKRILEISKLNTISSKKTVYPMVSKQDVTKEHQLSTCKKIFYKLHLEDGCILSNENKNKWYLSMQNDIVAFINVTYYDEKLCIYGRSTKNKKDFFKKPVCSSKINIYVSSGELNLPKLFQLIDFKCKLISLKYHNEFVFMPLLHTIR